MRTKSGRVAWFLFLGAALMLSSGCASWNKLEVGAVAGGFERLPRKVRVWFNPPVARDSCQVLLDARVEGDSLIGRKELPKKEARFEWEREPVRETSRLALPLSDVRRVECRATDPGKTALVVAGITLGAAVATIALAVALIAASGGIWAEN